MLDSSLASINSLNTSFGEQQLNCNKHNLPMTVLTAKRIQTLYKGNPATAINIRADSGLYMDDDMKYNKGIKTKSEEMKLKLKASKADSIMSPFELKMLMDLYKGGAAKLQSHRLGDYVDPYYDDPGDEETSRQRIGSCVSVKVEMEVAALKEKSRKSVDSIRSEKMALSGVKKRNAKLVQMLNAAGRIKYNGQNFDYFLDVIKKKQKKTIGEMKKFSGNMKPKIEKLKKAILYTELKTKRVNAIKRYPKKQQATLALTKSKTKKDKKTEWKAAADTRQSIKLKEDLLAWLKRANLQYSPKPPNKPSNQVTPKLSFVKPPPVLSSRKSKAFAEPRKSVVQLDRLFNVITPRYTDYSLAIESIGTPVPKSYSSVDRPLQYASPAYSSKSVETFATASARGKTPFSCVERKVESMKE